MNGVMIFLILFSIICTAIIAPFAQWNRYDINPTYFRRVKIRLGSYFIKGLGGKDSVYGDVRKYGVIYPMFLIQIFGYILSLCSCILVFVLIFALKISVTVTAIVTCSILLTHGGISAIIILTCVIITKIKDKV